eukprot:m.5231 g.5231  ORF g.5231 m.5231 type:complete len:94 (+) comp4166_c0_seq1:850-1131(+)
MTYCTSELAETTNCFFEPMKLDINLFHNNNHLNIVNNFLFNVVSSNPKHHPSYDVQVVLLNNVSTTRHLGSWSWQEWLLELLEGKEGIGKHNE